MEKRVAGHNLHNSLEEVLTAVLFAGEKTEDDNTWRTNSASILGSKCG